MSFGEDLKAEFKRIVMKEVVENGSCVQAVESYWGWRDIEANRHVSGSPSHAGSKPEACFLQTTSESDFLEHEIDEEGRTYENNRFTVIDVNHVNCSCGKIKDIKVRYEGELKDFIQWMFMEKHNIKEYS